MYSFWASPSESNGKEPRQFLPPREALSPSSLLVHVSSSASPRQCIRASGSAILGYPTSICCKRPSFHRRVSFLLNLLDQLASLTFSRSMGHWWVSLYTFHFLIKASGNPSERAIGFSMHFSFVCLKCAPLLTLWSPTCPVNIKSLLGTFYSNPTLFSLSSPSLTVTSTSSLFLFWFQHRRGYG
ncbi:hypothetical protein DPX39_040081600 [Trypanosoma brucei equiperdum]|uniref:Uncharacterized protein n=1 Tax=Trypanosoma brucei equiperdum TaxID=630700 RepID=A0A3L6LCN4_9TRYP|nr:hypothetical protein DPX39_040081600 [Trypanosoma brucei equiperdum]